MQKTEDEPEIVQQARLAIKNKKHAQWSLLLLSSMFLLMLTMIMKAAVGALDTYVLQEVSQGFVVGFIVGSLGALLAFVIAACFRKYVEGFANDCDNQRMLIRYHDELISQTKET